MDLNLYRHFLTIAESYTISEAAVKLNIAQPALSTQLKKLESYYGVQLIRTRQGSRHIELTSAGKMLYRRIKHILSEADLLRLDIRSEVIRDVETVSIGTTPELSMAVSNCISGYMCEAGKSRWRLDVGDKGTLSDALDREEIQCMFVSTLPAENWKYDIWGRFQRRIHVVLRADSELISDQSYLRLSALEGVPICFTLELEDAFFQACREARIEIPIYMRGTSISSVIDVAYSRGLPALIGGSLPKWAKGELVEVPLRDRYLQAEHCCCTKRGNTLSEKVEKFLYYMSGRDDRIANSGDDDVERRLKR